MKLPLLVSVPHAGLLVPPEVEDLCVLTEQQILADSDEGAAEIYELQAQMAAFATTDIARAIVDLNRSEDDRGRDGVVKTHTCWDAPVYDPLPPEEVVETLLARYYRPYHDRLRELARVKVRLGVDCHTMAAEGPPVGPDPGKVRPWVCLSNADGTCPQEWLHSLAECLRRSFGCSVSINDPFKGGFITRSHAAELPWVQLELSRAPFGSNAEKREGVLEALKRYCSDQGF